MYIGKCTIYILTPNKHTASIFYTVNTCATVPTNRQKEEKRKNSRRQKGIEQCWPINKLWS